MRFDGARRKFLIGSTAAGAGLVLGFYLHSRRGESARHASNEPDGFRPNAWLRIAPDGVIAITLAKSEMGQGVWTALPMLVAEELEADWRRVRVEQAETDPAYGDQETGGSSSVRGSWETLRQAGAVAREMLVAAAAATWGVAPGECRARHGVVTHPPSKRMLGYGELSTTAARQPVPQAVALKPPARFRIIGKPFPGLDAPSKTGGRARFGADVRLPGMRIAAIAHCPYFGGTPTTIDDSRARTIPGVRSIVPLDHAVAVVAEHYWAARQGVGALVIQWTKPGKVVDSGRISGHFRALVEKSGVTVREEGDVERGLAGAAKVVEAVYETPYQAHTTMEPMNCTAHLHDGICEVWAPTQSPGEAQAVAFRHAFPAVERWWHRLRARLQPGRRLPVVVHTTFLGGGFGRRLEQDYVAEAVQIARHTGAPVKLLWSREEDIQHDVYRPASRHHLIAGLDARGRPLVWQHRIAGPSLKESLDPGSVKNGHDPTNTQGAAQLPYAIPNLRVQYAMAQTGVPCGYWRSVGHSNNAFVVECFLDELAAASGQDPLAFRLALLADEPRHRAVLALAARKAGWGRRRAAGRFQGLAVHKSFGSVVAQVAEISVGKAGEVRVHRVVCAIDCGLAVNPNAVAAQMEGSVAYALSAALKGEITIDDGRVAQSNFHDYPILRFDEMPEVETHIVPSAEPPAGVGEPGVPPTIPAMLNAIHAATGRRIRRLPVRAEDLR